MLTFLAYFFSGIYFIQHIEGCVDKNSHDTKDTKSNSIKQVRVGVILPVEELD